MVRTILTHPGGAHKDEVLAVCVLIAKYGVPVLRREPTEAELDDPGVAIVDVGGRHEPDLMNFDHHHFPREHPPTCALSLVLQHLGLYEEALTLCDWLEVAEWFDSRGPNETAAWLDVPRRAISQLNSPVDMTLLRRFAAETHIEPGRPLYAFMRFIGEDLLDYLDTARQRIQFVAERAKRWTLARNGAALEVVFLPRTEPMADEPSASVASYIRTAGLHDQIGAIVYPDRRGSGYGVARYNDHPALDFSRLESEPDVVFAHKRGFMLKTTATDEARLGALIEAAWR